MVEYEEKREYIRLTASTPLRFTILDSQEQHQGQCFNLSGGGILFATETALEIGAIIDIALSTEGSFVPPLEARVKVIRVTESDDGHYTIAGQIQTVA